MDLTIAELVSKAIMDTHVRDNLLFLKQAKVEHPHGDNRHLETGTVTATSLASLAQTSASVTFLDAFVSDPHITFGILISGDNGSNTPAASPNGSCWISALATTGFTLYVRNHSNGTQTILVHWVAFGQD
jgi:hypothetical protein